MICKIDFKLYEFRPKPKKGGFGGLTKLVFVPSLTTQGGVEVVRCLRGA